MTSPVARRALLAAAGLALGLAVAAAGYLAWRLATRASGPAPEEALGAIGGDFTLTGKGGRQVSLGDLRGRAVLLFFGYTHCPDVCPSTLYAMAQTRKALGADAQRLQGVFISVDPARDTPDRLQEYVSYFDPSFLGLTGSEAELRKVAKAYGAHFELDEPSADGSYLVAHTSFGYLIGPEGKVVKLFQAGTSPDVMAEAVRALF